MHEFTGNREMQTYRFGSIETPFQGQEQNEDRTLGQIVTATRIYKGISLIGLSISFLLLLVVIVELTSPRIHVLYAEVLQNGFVKAAGTLPPEKKS